MNIADDVLLDALSRQWHTIRFAHDLRLRVPMFALHGGRTRLGLWMRGQRTISMSREHCLQDDWLDVSETLLHEVAHQVVDELMGGDSTPHGPRFQRVLAELGALPLSTGEEPPVVDRVRKLLALAASSNRHEAELAMSRAQKLMIKHRIDRASFDGARGVVRRRLGEPRARQSRWRGSLAAVVSQHFFVEVVRLTVFLPTTADTATIWEIAGRPEDVEMASYAYDFVAATAERLWAAHLAANPGSGRSRDRFLLGVVLGFRQKLDATAEEARQEGLVPQVDAEVQRAWQARHPRLRSGGRSTFIADAHYHAGREAGGNVVLHRPVSGKTGGGGLLEG
jgi:hypothetical protein